MGQQIAGYCSSVPNHARADGQEAPGAEWPATWQVFDDRLLVSELAAAKAQDSPHSLALAAAGQRLTYGELEQRANRLAHYLLSRGAGPNRPVVLCLPRSPEFVVTALAVLKTGAAYVPLDPTCPPDRLTKPCTMLSPKPVPWPQAWS